MDIDSIYRLLGQPGRYQVIIYLLLCCNYFPVVINHLVMAFYGARVPHRCHVPNTTHHAVADTCEILYTNVTADTNYTVACEDRWGWEYDVEEGERNIIMEFDLVCDRKSLSRLATTIYFLGVMIGGLIFGGLSDRYGRKPFMILTLVAQVAVGTGIAFSPTYIVFVLLRFIQGVLMQGLQTCSFVLIMELFTAEHRTAVGTIVEVFWGVGVMWLACVAWLIKDWKYIQLAITLPCLLSVACIWIVPESLHWLVTNNKYEEAEVVVRKAAKINNVHIADDVFNRKSVPLVRPSDEDTASKAPQPANVLDMFKTPKMRKRSFILFYVWFVMSLCYYGLSLTLTNLAGNKYLNLFLGGLMELPAYCAAVFILQRFGRRLPLCVYLFLGGSLCILAGVIPNQIGGVDIYWLPTALAVLGRFGMAGCFSVIPLFTCELYPTVIRNVSCGACAFWTRVGGVLAPQVLLLGEITFPWLPVIIFGTASVIGGAITLLLPETLNAKLPDTVSEAEDIEPYIEPVEMSVEMSVEKDSELPSVDNSLLHTNVSV